MLIHNYDQLAPFVNSIQASYAWLYKSLDVMVRMDRTPSIDSLIEAKHKNQVRIEIQRYMEKLRQEATRDDLGLSAHNMKKCIGCHVMVNTMMHMLQDELDTSSRTIYPEFMEARVNYQKDTIKYFEDVITHYQSWNQYVTEKSQVEVVELVFPQTSQSQCFVLLGYLQPILSHIGICGKCNIKISTSFKKEKKQQSRFHIFGLIFNFELTNLDKLKNFKCWPC